MSTDSIKEILSEKYIPKFDNEPLIKELCTPNSIYWQLFDELEKRNVPKNDGG